MKKKIAVVLSVLALSSLANAAPFDGIVNSVTAISDLPFNVVNSAIGIASGAPIGVAQHLVDNSVGTVGIVSELIDSALGIVDSFLNLFDTF